jgi:stress-induced-phosphoprotein 1
MPTAEEFKAAGNAALQAGNVTEAVEQYTKAINADGANHVYFSNRSAAYLKKGDAHNALEDAEACLGLNPEFAKGYSRRGAALHALKRYNDSMASYNKGLEKFPTDAGLKKGLEDATREKDAPYGSSTYGSSSSDAAAGGLFNPAMMAQMAMNPKMKPYLNDPAIMSKIQEAQKNPNLLPTMLSDPKMMEFLGLMMGQGGMGEDGEDAPRRTPVIPPKKTEVKPVVEDWSNLTPEERKVKETQKAANDKKTEGNEFYKKRDFENALKCYDEAIAIDSTSMAFLSNKAAVYFTQKKYQECIDECNKAIEVGKANRASFEDRAKALTRCAKAYQMVGDLGMAIEMCNAAQLEAYDKTTQRLLKNLELEKRKTDATSYQDDAKAEEAKQRGNDFFRAQEFGDAVKEYEDAVKRAPKNAAIRNNLSAALCKIMDFNGAKREVEKAIELDPKYVKAWARKGDIEVVMKENHKAQDSYKMGLNLDPNNTTCKEGLRKVMQLINYGRQNMTADEKKEQASHAMADPQIQAILSDPVVQQTLRDFQENPTAANAAMNDPDMRAKIERLIAAGIIETA